MRFLLFCSSCFLPLTKGLAVFFYLFIYAPPRPGPRSLTHLPYVVLDTVTHSTILHQLGSSSGGSRFGVRLFTVFLCNNHVIQNWFRGDFKWQ